ncbi:hypothetical protein PRNP1_001073 [Phytophthora ramorum]
MMAASSGFMGASSDSSEASSRFPSTSKSTVAADDEFGSFAAAEGPSDPFGDVYGAETDFGGFVGGSSETQEAPVSSAAVGGSSVPLTAPPTLLPSISGEVDPFADITGGLGAVIDAGEAAEQVTEVASSSGGDFAAPPASTSAILDLVWGQTSQDTELSASTSLDRTASNPGGFVLPPPPSKKTASFPVTGGAPEVSTGDLLSFSPVQTSTKDPFFEISSDTTATAPRFGNDDLFTLTATPPISATSSSAPTSLRGSFASLHEDVKPSMISPTAPRSVETKTSPRDVLAERSTRSFGSLSSSFVSVGAMENTSDQNGVQASFNSFTVAPDAATSGVTPSPSSAPPSLHSSFKMTDGFMGFASTADDSDEVDPFAEAGLAAPEEVPLAEALAAWNTSAEPVVLTDEEDNVDSDEEQPKEEEDAVFEKEPSKGSSSKDVEPLVVDEGITILDTFAQAAVTEAEPLDVWDSSHSSAPKTPDPSDKHVDDSVLTEQQHPADVIAVDASATAVEFERQSCVPFAKAAEEIACAEHDENVNVPVADDNEDEVHSVGLQDNAFEGDEIDSDPDDVSVESGGVVVWSAEQSSVECHDAEREGDVEGIGETLSSVSNEDTSLPPSAFITSYAAAPSPAELSEKLGDDFGAENDTKDSEEQNAGVENGDDFDDFGGFETAAAPTINAVVIPDASPWGSPTRVQNMPIEDDDSVFGDFAVAASSFTVENSAPAAVENDDFADFTQSTELNGENEFGDFGDFTQSATASSFSGFQQSSSEAFGDDDDGFGDFTPSNTTAATTPLTPMPAPSFSKTDLSTFFKDAFPVELLPTNTLSQPESPTYVKNTAVIQEPSTDFVQDVFRTMWDEYFEIIATTSCHPSSSPGSLSPAPDSSDEERVHLERKTTCASKYLKYVLSEKIQEASRQNGIFPHGSERHQMYIGFATSGDADRMRSALKELQDALFHSSVNDAMMRIAKQAALSAKAKIAEQAAQQQANSRGGSLFSTTRHLLSRGGSAGGAHGPGSSGNDTKADHAGADTPTGASVQKLARFSFTNSHDDGSNGHRGASGEERGSEGSDHTGHSSGSDSEAVGGANDIRTRSQTLSGSGSSNGGLMKKFQDRFSFASSRNRPRFVSLRRKGQSGEEVRKMELNLDAISGGLDEVKWKCAVFLYDVEEVAHVAPSQISILSYPGKQPLTGKTDRSALTKLVKPDTIWTVDIGANNSDMLNEW